MGSNKRLNYQEFVQKYQIPNAPYLNETGSGGPYLWVYLAKVINQAIRENDLPKALDAAIVVRAGDPVSLLVKEFFISNELKRSFDQLMRAM